MIESAAERTGLAWRRTTLASTVVAILAVRLALTRDLPFGAVAAAALWLAVLWISYRRAFVALTIAIAGYSLLGALLVLAGVGA